MSRRPARMTRSSSRRGLFLSLVAASVVASISFPGRPARAQVLDAYREERLPSGLLIWWIDRQDSPVVSARWVLPAGSRFDPDSLEGTAVLTAHAVLEGPQGRSESSFLEEFEGRGAQLSALVEADATIFRLEAPRDVADSLLRVLAGALADPALSSASLQRGVEDARRLTVPGPVDAGSLAEAELVRNLYAGHPYGRGKWGSEASWRRLAAGALQAFHRARYAPARAHLIIVGRVDFDSLLRFLGAARPGPLIPGPGGRESPPGPPVSASRRRVVLLDLPGSDVAAFRVGLSTVSRRDPDALPLTIAGILLGDGPLSLVQRRLRLQAGVAYTAGGQFLLNDLGGVWMGGSEVPARKTAVALREFLEALRQVSQVRGGTQQYLEAQTYWRGRRQLVLESPARCSDSLVQVALAGSTPADWRALPERLADLDPISWSLAVGRRFDPGEAVIVVAAPADEVQQDLGTFGPVEVVRPAE